MAQSFKNNFPFKQWMRELEIKGDEIAKRVAEEARDHFVEQFDNQEWEGKDWQPLKDSTLKYKASQGYGSTPLVNTGNLRSALVNCIKKASWKDGVVLNVDTDYAQYQNNGTDTIPARKFFEDSYELQKRWNRALDEEIRKIIN